MDVNNRDAAVIFKLVEYVCVLIPLPEMISYDYRGERERGRRESVEAR